MRVKAKKAVVFGVFDRLHPGHLYFLYHARLKAAELTALVARDSAVRQLKRHSPHDKERVRRNRVRDTGLVSKAVLGDKKEGEYAVLKKIRPDLVILGYDQKGLEKDLRRAMRAGDLPKIQLLKIRAYKPRKFHTSKLKG